MENKTSRYLLYAIGEIILVVTGILIALQVNNWNEARKDREIAKSLAKNVDFTENVEHIRYHADMEIEYKNNRIIPRVKRIANLIGEELKTLEQAP